MRSDSLDVVNHSRGHSRVGERPVRKVEQQEQRRTMVLRLLLPTSFWQTLPDHSRSKQQARLLSWKKTFSSPKARKGECWTSKCLTEEGRDCCFVRGKKLNKRKCHRFGLWWDRILKQCFPQQRALRASWTPECLINYINFALKFSQSISPCAPPPPPPPPHPTCQVMWHLPFR